MPTILGEPYPPCFQGFPGGMTSGDLELWKRFRDKYCTEWIRIYFNVRVGKGSPSRENYTDELQEAWMFLTQHRIDAVLEYEDHIMITEFRRHAGRSAFGACILYPQLWAKDPKINKQVTVAVVTDFLTEQILESFQENGIKTYII